MKNTGASSWQVKSEFVAENFVLFVFLAVWARKSTEEPLSRLNGEKKKY
jgi:hypothetical protein